MELFKYNNELHLTEISRRIRQNPMSNKEHMMQVGRNLYIKDRLSRLFINATLQLVFDSYGVDKDPKVRRKLIFTESYQKGQPERYMNKVIDVLLKDKNIDSPEITIQHILDRIKSQFYRLSIIVNDIVTKNHSILGYVDAYLKYPEYKDMIDNGLYSETDNPWEVQRKIDAAVKKFESGEIYISPLSDYYKSGVKANRTQIQVFAIDYGITPDAARTDIALKPIKGPLIRRIKKIEDLLKMANIGILARYRGKNDVKIGGTYYKHIVSMLLLARLNYADTREVIHDCETTKTIKIKINKESDLEYFRFKNFINNKGQMEYIDVDRLDLIGKTLNVRSIMTCKGEIVCLKCFGYHNKFMRDNKVYFYNYPTLVTHHLSAVIQGVISLKHFMSAIIQPIIISYGDIKDVNLEEFISKYDVIERMEFNKLVFNKKYKVRHTHGINPKDPKDKRGKNTLYINDIPFETTQNIYPNFDGTYSIDIPNDSVLANAERLYQVIAGNGNFIKDNPDFESYSLEGKLMFIYNFIKDRVKLKHFIEYETLVYVLGRDAEDRSKRITETTKSATFVPAINIISSPGDSPNIGIGLVHGYIKACFELTDVNTTPAETDVLYNRISQGRHSSKGDLYNEFGKILRESTFTRTSSENDFRAIMAEESYMTNYGVN